MPASPHKIVRREMHLPPGTPRHGGTDAVSGTFCWGHAPLSQGPGGTGEGLSTFVHTYVRGKDFKSPLTLQPRRERERPRSLLVSCCSFCLVLYGPAPHSVLVLLQKGLVASPAQCSPTAQAGSRSSGMTSVRQRMGRPPACPRFQGGPSTPLPPLPPPSA